MSDQQKGYSYIIVGAGIIGSALASAIATEERRALLIERDFNEPDRIVGELLQPGGVLKLKELGLRDCIENIDGIDVHGYAVLQSAANSHNGTEYRQVLRYPLHEGKTVMGKSFHHGRFVMNLRKAAKSNPYVDTAEGTATKVIQDTKDGSIIGVTYKKSTSNNNNNPAKPKPDDIDSGNNSTQSNNNNNNNNNSDVNNNPKSDAVGDGVSDVVSVYAPLTIICDGCSSNFRRQLISEKPAAKSHFVGLIIENCSLPFPNYGHVFLEDPAPILGYQIGSNEIRILVDIPDPLPKDLPEYLSTHTAPQLPLEIRESFLKALKEQRVRKMPNSKLHPDARHVQEGVIMLGDAWNMRHPLTGGGMTVALSDAVILRDILRDQIKDLNDKGSVTLALKRFDNKRKGLACTINILAFALYDLFVAADDPTLPVMRHACLEYFKLGGTAVSGPMSLLSGLCGKPSVLMYHFFSVALYGVYRVLFPFPTPSKIWQSYKLLAAAAWIVIPLMRGEKVFSLFTYILSIVFFIKRGQTPQQKKQQ